MRAPLVFDREEWEENEETQMREHSVDAMARILSPLLEDTAEFPTPGWENQRLTQAHLR
jgi:hypothetical protein